MSVVFCFRDFAWARAPLPSMPFPAARREEAKAKRLKRNSHKRALETAKILRHTAKIQLDERGVLIQGFRKGPRPVVANSVFWSTVRIGAG